MKFIFNNNQPIYLQIVEQLRIYIVSGKISPSEKLPSVRELAEQLKVNPNTIARSLAILEDEGIIITERTNGKYVTSNTKLIKKVQHQLADKNAKSYFNTMSAIGFDKKTAIKFLTKEK